MWTIKKCDKVSSFMHILWHMYLASGLRFPVFVAVFRATPESTSCLIYKLGNSGEFVTKNNKLFLRKHFQPRLAFEIRDILHATWRLSVLNVAAIKCRSSSTLLAHNIVPHQENRDTNVRTLQPCQQQENEGMIQRRWYLQGSIRLSQS